MVNGKKSWRLLDSDTTDAKMNLAISEAIFRCRRAGLSPDTIYLWHSAEPAILFSSASRDEVAQQATREEKCQLLRVEAVAGHASFSDAGSINFSIVVDLRLWKPLIAGDYQPLLSEYEFLLDYFAAGIRKLGVQVAAQPYGIYTDAGKEIASAQPAWRSDTLLLQGTIFVTTEEKTLRSAFKREITSLDSELNHSISLDEVLGIVVQELEEKSNMVFERHGLTAAEQRLAAKLCRTKYGADKWNIEGKAPFLALTGETLVALYVANPPTSKCRGLIEKTTKAASDVDEEVKVVVWRRGVGADQHPLEDMPPVIGTLSKANILPAVVINNECKFALEVPSENQLREAIQNPGKFPDILESL